MLYFLVYVIFSWSLTDILVGSWIFERPRNFLIVKSPILGKLFSCVQCMGFWVGFALGVASCEVQTPISPFVLEYGPLLWFFNGLFVSGTSVLMNAVIYRLSK